MKKRKDGRYEFKATIDGVRKTFYGRSKAEAKEKYRAYEEEKERGPLFSDYADTWETSYEARVAPNSYRSIPARVREAKQRFDGKYLSEIAPKQISNYAKALAQSGKTQKTVKEYLSVLRMIFKQAIIDGHIETSPAELIQAEGKESTPRELPTDAELEIVRASVKEPFGLFPFLIMYTGLRKGEALGLMYQDIDRKNKTISVSRSVYHIHGKTNLKEPKTQKGIRQVPLLDALFDVLPDQQIGYVFPGKDSGPMSSAEYGRSWKTYAEATGITCTPHQLRHAMATFCFEADLDEKDAQDILGHADISTTRNIYTHIRDSRRQVSAEKLNRYLSSECRQDSKKVNNKAT